MPGFDAGDRELPRPVVDVGPDTRARMTEVLVAVIDGATPEEIAGYLQDGFPTSAFLNEPGQAEEVDAYVDALLAVIQSPVDATPA